MLLPSSTWLQKHWLRSKVARVMARSTILKSKLKSISSECRKKNIYRIIAAVRTFLADEWWRAKNKQKLFATHGPMGKFVPVCVWHVAYLAAEHTRLEHSQLVGIAVYLLLTSHYFISAQRQRRRSSCRTAEQDQSKEKRLSQARGPCAMCHVPDAWCLMPCTTTTVLFALWHQRLPRGKQPALS